MTETSERVCSFRFMFGVLRCGVGVVAPKPFGEVAAGDRGVLIRVTNDFPTCLVWWDSLQYAHWVPITLIEVDAMRPEVHFKDELLHS